ncbi:hypothetical protein AWC38_SpisGene2490 [Stylophora pistillata]|uniref:Uncharacterized protein n=1 Tax=Stylophora pistillata TaxID=50429 RepID=A0A2B4STI5_STYPI|nr:hypothetical protein AWC38_SpisGene2490 [Stylophora pistillata]
MYRKVISVAMDDLVPPEENPENMPSATEELLQIMEDFADVIDKFMFEIVTFLAVVDSAMGLIKDVLGLFGFAGWKMAFFPTFSFIVTTGVFLFGAKKRKGKRESDVPEGLADAFEALEDVMEVVEDVAEGLEEMDGDGSTAEGDLGDVIGDVVGSNVNLPIGEMGGLQEAGESNNSGVGQGDTSTSNNPADSNQNMARKVIAVAVLAAGIIAKFRKKKSGDTEETVQETNTSTGGEGTSKDFENQEAGARQESLQGTSQQNDWLSGKKAAVAGVSIPLVDDRNPLASTMCRFNESVIIDLDLADRGKRFVETDWQSAATSSVISGERQLRWNSRQLVRGVERGASEIKHEIERVPLSETRIQIDEGPSHRQISEHSDTFEKQVTETPFKMASGVVKGTANLAGSTAQAVDQTARQGVEQTRQKSGSMLHIAIRLARLVVRVVNKKKGRSSSSSQKSEESTNKAVSSSTLQGSTESVNSDSIYFDCVSSLPPRNMRKQAQPLIYTQYKYLMCSSTQTEHDNFLPLSRSEPQISNISNSTGILSPRSSHWDTLRRSVASMPDAALKGIRDAAIGEITFRGNPSEEAKLVNDTGTLRPTMVSSRDETREEIPRDLRKTKGHDGIVTAHVHQTKDAVSPKAGTSEESGTSVSMHERESTQSSPHDFPSGIGPDLDGQGYSKAGGSGRRHQVDLERSRDPRERNVRGYRGLVPFHDRGRGQTSQYLDSVHSYEKPRSRRNAESVQDRHSTRDPRVRNVRSTSSYEYLEDDYLANRSGQHSKEKSSKRPDSSGSRRSLEYKSRSPRRSTSYENPDEDSVFEEEGRFYNRDQNSEVNNCGRNFKSQPRYSSRLPSFEHDAVDPFFPEHDAVLFPEAYPRSDSSGSVEVHRSSRRSHASLSSVRFADEIPIEGNNYDLEPRNRGNWQGNVDSPAPLQELRRRGQHGPNRKTPSNPRWNSAVCLTGHQKAKILASPKEPHTNDNYIFDETASPNVRQGSKARVNRGPSFNRLSRGPSTMSRVQSASYLGDDESDVRA